LLRRRLDCFVAELVIGPATSGRTRWVLAMTVQNSGAQKRVARRLPYFGVAALDPSGNDETVIGAALTIPPHFIQAFARLVHHPAASAFLRS